MQRLKWPLFALFTVFVFTAGVLCGMYWQPHVADPVAEERPKAPSPPPVPVLAEKTPPQKPEKKAPEPQAPLAPKPEEAPAASAPPPAPRESTPVQEPPVQAAQAEKIPESPPAPEKKPAGEKEALPALAGADPFEDSLPFTPSPYSFTLRKLGPGNGSTLMVVGGIQGDEPGGFSAAALIASHYTIKFGAVWVVPDLNFPSILDRSRGVSGDLNRKFAQIRADDPDYATVMQIKSILLDDRVSLILNLHDGSGFYRPTWEDQLRNPKRWGQSVIIDQKEMESPRFNLYETANLVGGEVNKRLLDPNHRYHIYNTYTAAGNVEMSKTLSYFAVCNGKPAFGVEASKEIRPEYRAYYHLQIIEAFMRQMGIEYERDFPLSPEGVLTALNSNLRVAFFDNRLVLPLENIRPTLNMIPFKKDAVPSVRASKPLLALVPDKKQKNWRVAYGNRTLTQVNPLFLDFDYSLQTVNVLLDGKAYTVHIGDIVTVRDSFLVRDIPGYRVNAIGAQKEKNGTEADVLLTRKDFSSRFSMDTEGTTYRVEIYKGRAFAGMILVNFDKGRAGSNVPLTAIGGAESSLGF